MNVFGVDFLGLPAGATYPDLYRWGVRFVGRYTGSLTAAEITAIHMAGLGVGPIFYERDPSQALEGFAVGRADANAALAWRTAAGVPVPIVLACDREVHDVTPVAPYYRGCADVAGPLARAYGDADLLDGLAALHLPAAAGVGCSAWSSGRESAAAHIHQYYDDYPPDAPNLEAHGLHYGQSYDLERLLAAGTDLIWWPPAAHPDTPGDDMPKLVRFVQEAGDTRQYLEVDGQVTWMSGPDVLADYAQRMGIGPGVTQVRKGYLAGRPGYLPPVPPAKRAAR